MLNVVTNQYNAERFTTKTEATETAETLSDLFRYIVKGNERDGYYLEVRSQCGRDLGYAKRDTIDRHADFAKKSGGQVKTGRVWL